MCDTTNEEIAHSIAEFRRFVELSWPVVGESLPLGIEGAMAQATVEDWLQANWELLVEARALGPRKFLPPYFEGGDLHESGRVSFADSGLPTHRLVCRLLGVSTDVLSGESLAAGAYVFEAFGHVADDGLFLPTPPLNQVKLVQDINGDETDRVVVFAGVQFEIEPAS